MTKCVETLVSSVGLEGRPLVLEETVEESARRQRAYLASMVPETLLAKVLRTVQCRRSKARKQVQQLLLRQPPSPRAV